MTDIQRTDFLAGEIDAMIAIVSALIESHPDRRMLEAAYAQARKRVTAATITSTVSNSFVRGQHQMVSRLKPLFDPPQRELTTS